MAFDLDEWKETRERLRLDLETYLRERYSLGEQWEAIPEDWRADWRADVYRGGAWEVLGNVCYMGFRLITTGKEYLRAMPISDFEEWRKERQ